MAERITDNGDLIEREILTEYDIEQLGTVRLNAESPKWATRHKRAWRKVKDHLALRPTPIEEDDLDDTTELIKATCFYVAYLACKQARGERYIKMAEEMHGAFVKEMEEIEPTSNGVSIARGSYAFRRARRV